MMHRHRRWLSVCGQRALVPVDGRGRWS